MLIVLVYSCGHISGAHFNPAVTLAIYIRGKCTALDIPKYIISQLLETVVAVYLGGSV